MRMHSADFAVARCPSHAGIMLKRLNGQPYHSSFSVPNLMAIFRRGSRMHVGYEKIADFRPLSRFTSEMILDRAIVTM